jgi:hypothetical protein
LSSTVRRKISPSSCQKGGSGFSCIGTILALDQRKPLGSWRAGPARREACIGGRSNRLGTGNARATCLHAGFTPPHDHHMSFTMRYMAGNKAFAWDLEMKRYIVRMRRKQSKRTNQIRQKYLTQVLLCNSMRTNTSTTSIQNQRQIISCLTYTKATKTGFEGCDLALELPALLARVPDAEVARACSIITTLVDVSRDAVQRPVTAEKPVGNSLTRAGSGDTRPLFQLLIRSN